MQRKNIPAYVLAKGISKTGFEELLVNIKDAAIEEGVNKFNDYAEMIESIKSKATDANGQAETNQWISDFEEQLAESTKIINENVYKIEELFNRIFDDWEKYREEHGIVEEIVVEDKKEKKSKKKKTEVAEGDNNE